MQVKSTKQSDTQVKLTVVPSPSELIALKNEVLLHMSKRHTNVPGFRSGKAPLSLVEKNIDSGQLQTEFLDTSINELFMRAVESENLKPIDQPTVTIKKFVPYTELEFDVELEVIGDLVLADYQKIKLAKKQIEITATDVNEVLKALRQRAADKSDVSRAAKAGDEVTIDFSGIDTKTNEPVNGATSKDFPLILGSDAFIPGFEKNVVGLKAGEEKTFDLVFPKDYSVATLRSRKVTFTISVKKVQELKELPLDDNFAQKVSPMKTLKDLKVDIKKQLQIENQTKADRAYENELLMKITEASSVSIPKKLIDEQIERSEIEEKQNLAYRGQTWQEHLSEEGVSEEEHRERNRSVAEHSVKASLILSEIAKKEKIPVSLEEIDVRIQILKGQYQDPQTQGELDKPENRQTIANQILTEKTFEFLVKTASK